MQMSLFTTAKTAKTAAVKTTIAKTDPNCYDRFSMHSPNLSTMADDEWNAFILKIDQVADFSNASRRDRRLQTPIRDYVYAVARNAALNGKSYRQFDVFEGIRMWELSSNHKRSEHQTQLQGLDRPTWDEIQDIVLQAFLDVKDSRN